MKQILYVCLLCILLAGCESLFVSPGYSPDYDPDALEYHGHVVSKRRSDSADAADAWRYQVALLDGQLLTVESLFPAFKKGDCVKVFVSEGQPSRMAFASGCAFRQVPIEEVQVVHAVYLPAHSYATEAIIGRGSGLGKGAADGALVGAVAPLYASVYSAPYLIAVYPYIAPITIGIGLISGGIYGAAVSIPEERVAEINASLQRLASGPGVQELFRREILAAGGELERPLFRASAHPGSADPGSVGDYRHLSLPSGSAVLEVAITDLVLSGGRGEDPEISLTVQARVRLVMMVEGIAPSDFSFLYVSDARKSSEWFRDDDELLRRELEGACKEMAKEVVKEFFR
ncbi:MAG: hypothetical protein ABW086_09885 [Sedimenticola sp.]